MNRQARGWMILGGFALTVLGVELLFSVAVDAGPGITNSRGKGPASDVRHFPRSKDREPAKMKQKLRGPGIPWNGGKPGIPVDLWSDLSGPIPPDADTSVVLSLVVDLPCSDAGVIVRGIEGVVVVGESRFELGPCRPTEEFQVPVRIRIPSGGSGFLAVDVDVEMVSSDDGSTSHQRASKAVQVVAMGAKFRPKSIGKAGVAAKPSPGAKADPAGVVELGNGSNAR